MIMRNGRLTPLYILVTLGLVSLFLYYRSSTVLSTRTYSPIGWKSRNRAANSTLGFGALYVVSGHGSPRREHLHEAAAVSELELRIPEQPEWSEADVARLRWHNESESLIKTGSAKAWLSHLVVLRDFLGSGEETALIIEDDVDWDIRLRTFQIPLAQKAAQTLFEAEGIPDYPWGTPEDWDVIFVGHCGDYFNDLSDGIGVGHHHPHQLADVDHLLYADETIPWRTDLHPFTASFLTALSVPERTRIFHQSIWPLCSFGYAVTRHSAQKIINEVAPPKEDISKRIVAYDVALMHGCGGENLLNCFTITPEMFHHMEGLSIIDIQTATDGLLYRPPVDLAGMEQVQYRQETSNIGCGFWSGEFYYSGDMERLELLREEVGRKGNCLKPGRENGRP